MKNAFNKVQQPHYEIKKVEKNCKEYQKLSLL